MANSEVVYRWRADYVPRFTTKNGENNRRSYEAIARLISERGPQTRDALEGFARRFTWHHQYSANIPGGIEYVRWHISHGNLIPAGK